MTADILKMDRSRDFGTITPAWQPDDCDRPAYYEQDGKLFDAHDQLIEPGKPLPAPKVAEATAETAEAITPYDLLRQADVMAWAKFKKHAKAILGATCPGGKAEIVAALQESVQHFEQRQAKRKPGPKVAEEGQKSAGLTWNGITGQSDEGEENLTAKPAPKLAPGEIDLAAWGRGQKEYLFSEVRKAIRTKHHAAVTKRCDAVDILIDAKVISAAERRRDVDAER